MKEETSQFIKPILQFASILIVGAMIVAGTTWITNYFKKPSVIQTAVQVVAQPPQCPNDFISYEKLVNAGQAVNLVNKDLNSYALDGNFVNGKYITVTRSGADEIACGYIYIRAGLGGHSLNPEYDSIFVNPQGLGGHILASKTITIPKSSSTTTEMLLPLESVPYIEGLPYNPDSQDYQSANWVDLLNASNKTNFQVGLSTNDSTGIIDQITIAYQCWNPSTNQVSNNCQLGVQ